jgi:hypothetical protein
VPGAALLPNFRPAKNRKRNFNKNNLNLEVVPESSDNEFGSFGSNLGHSDYKHEKSRDS